MAPLGLLVIQPTPFCNIDCSYCYLGDRSNRTRMTISTVDAVVRFVRHIPLAKSPLSVVWHAGEPLVVPISFYEQAFQCFAADSPPIPVEHHFQTNAILLNDEWCKFIKRSSVRIGISIDGPKHIHDAYRIDRSGRGTFDRVMAGIAKLREHDIPFTVISVITREALDQPDEVWEFLASIGASHLAFNVEEAEGVHRRSSLADGDLRDQARNFFSRIAELQERKPRIPVTSPRPLKALLFAPITGLGPFLTSMPSETSPHCLQNFWDRHIFFMANSFGEMSIPIHGATWYSIPDSCACSRMWKPASKSAGSLAATSRYAEGATLATSFRSWEHSWGPRLNIAVCTSRLLRM
jgi:MoaA/NifB/PqqE/SkfB family radical SAM enzyme